MHQLARLRCCWRVIGIYGPRSSCWRQSSARCAKALPVSSSAAVVGRAAVGWVARGSAGSAIIASAAGRSPCMVPAASRAGNTHPARQRIADGEISTSSM